MTDPNQPVPKHYTMEIPTEVVDGHFADVISVWHTRDTFVLDFAALKAAPQRGEQNGAPVLNHPTRVVSRVRIPPAQVFELMKALEAQLSAWEREAAGSAGG